MLDVRAGPFFFFFYFGGWKQFIQLEELDGMQSKTSQKRVALVQSSNQDPPDLKGKRAWDKLAIRAEKDSWLSRATPKVLYAVKSFPGRPQDLDVLLEFRFTWSHQTCWEDIGRHQTSANETWVFEGRQDRSLVSSAYRWYKNKHVMVLPHWESGIDRD